ncbi:MAG TPA: alcohol dehydrogenase catalytic domain-containing protein [Streptosporangiaceae bacterium]
MLIEVRAVGICGTDLRAPLKPAIFTPGVILGHEFAGRPGRPGPAPSPRRSCRWPSTRRRSPPSSTPGKRSRSSWTRGSERLPERRLSGQPDRWSRRIG